MSQSCPREPEAVRAVVTGAWSEDLQRHAAACPACRDTVELAEVFARSRSEEAWEDSPDAPAAIWWRARADELLSDEIERCERRERPLVFGRRAAGLQLFFALPHERLASTGFTPLSAALVAGVAVPTAALIHYLRRQAAGG
jgi:hypothetical protein